MQERVSIIEGNNPIVIVAPHGGDDDFTGELTEAMAAACDGYAVINWGWRRADNIDYDKSKANCNNVLHCLQDVVKDEFLDPIIKYINKLGNNSEDILFLTIHGVSNEVRKKAKDNSLDIIVGWGNGIPPSVTCDILRRDAFMYQASQTGIGVYQGIAGGQYSARSRTNLNQLFNYHYPDDDVSSLQIEIVKDMRSDKTMAQVTGEALGSVYSKYVKFISNEKHKIDMDFAKYRKSIPEI